MVVRYFFLYLVVFPTANTPFLIALVHKWCSTTWLGTGNTDPSSVNGGIFIVSIARVLEGTTPNAPELLGTGVDGTMGVEGVAGVLADAGVVTAVVVAVDGGSLALGVGVPLQTSTPTLKLGSPPRLTGARASGEARDGA